MLTLNAKVNPQVVWLVAAQIVSMTKLRKAFMTVGVMAEGVVLMHIEDAPNETSDVNVKQV